MYITWLALWNKIEKTARQIPVPQKYSVMVYKGAKLAGTTSAGT